MPVLWLNGVQVPQPTLQSLIVGWPHPSLPLKTLSEHWPVPLLPRKMCQSRYVSHPSAHLFSFLSKRCSFIFYCQQICSRCIGLCQEGLHAGSCPWETWYRGHPTAGTLIIVESSAGGICLQTSPASVWCPAGRGSRPFPMLPLLSAGVWPSTASG